MIDECRWNTDNDYDYPPSTMKGVCTHASIYSKDETVRKSCATRNNWECFRELIAEGKKCAEVYPDTGRTFPSNTQLDTTFTTAKLEMPYTGATHSTIAACQEECEKTHLCIMFSVFKNDANNGQFDGCKLYINVEKCWFVDGEHNFYLIKKDNRDTKEML